MRTKIQSVGEKDGASVNVFAICGKCIKKSRTVKLFTLYFQYLSARRDVINCSFISKEVKRDMDFFEIYIEKLIEEIRLSRKIIDDVGLKVAFGLCRRGDSHRPFRNLLDRLMDELSSMYSLRLWRSLRLKPEDPIP